jgi:hypothetical protein
MVVRPYNINSIVNIQKATVNLNSERINNLAFVMNVKSLLFPKSVVLT